MKILLIEDDLDLGAALQRSLLRYEKGINMQRKALTSIVGIALTIVSGFASATLTLNSYTPANTTVIYFGGSSSTNAQLKSWVKTYECSSNYEPITWINDANNFAIVCKISSSRNVAYVKNSTGGSAKAMSSLPAGSSTLTFMDVFQCGIAGKTPAPAAGPSATRCLLVGQRNVSSSPPSSART